jgi:membrane-bound ClpP family serine protease
MGEVVVGGKSYVAKAESGVIEKGSRVEVVGAGTRELIVRAKPAEPGATAGHGGTTASQG